MGTEVNNVIKGKIEINGKEIDLSTADVVVTETAYVIHTREYLIHIKNILNFKTEAEETAFAKELNDISSSEAGERFINKYTKDLSNEDAEKFIKYTQEFASKTDNKKLFNACETVDKQRKLLSEAKTAVASEVLRRVYQELKDRNLDISGSLDGIRTDSHFLAGAAKTLLDKISQEELIEKTLKNMCETIEKIAHARLAEKKKAEEKAEQEDLERRIKKIASLSTDPAVNEAINKVVTNPNSILNGFISDEAIMREVEKTQQEVRTARRNRANKAAAAEYNFTAA